MSKKRTSPVSDNDEKTYEGPDPIFQQQANAKRTKLDPHYDSKLQDLPIELLNLILVKAVVVEVKSMKLVKSVWKEKVDLVIGRLETVCSLWSNIVTTDYFRKEVHEILDGTAQPTIRLEMLYQSPIQLQMFTTKMRPHVFAAMKDEMFMLCRPQDQDFAINIHDRNNVAEVKDVIPLPGISPFDIAACAVSNCVYVLTEESKCHSVLRITKDEEHKFSISPWISDLRQSCNLPKICVSANGSLLVLTQQDKPSPAVVSIYNAYGSLQHEIKLSYPTVNVRIAYGVIQKSNGNIVLASNLDYDLRMDLTELDTSGSAVRRYKSSFRWCSGIGFADIHERILIACGDRYELLDSEFNLLDITDPRQPDNKSDYTTKLHYNGDRNEVSRMRLLLPNHTRALTVFRFIEE